MLPLSERLKRSHLFTKAYNARKSIVTPYFVLYVLPRLPKSSLNNKNTNATVKGNVSETGSKKSLPMTGFVVSKKVSKSACLRNKMKRRIRESYRLLRTESLSQWYVMILVIKENARNASWADLCRTMEAALGQAAHKYGRQ